MAAEAGDTEGKADALSSLAPLLRVRPIFDSLCRFGEQWASGHVPERDGWVPFHLVTAGSCVITVPGAGAHPLSQGDIALLPHGGAHVVHGADTPATLGKTPGLRSYATSTITVKTNVAEGEAPTELLCGRLQFELAQQNLVLAALPAIIVLRADDGSAAGRLQQMMITIRDELVTALPGAAAIANDLASALMVMVLRLHIAQQNMNLGLFGLLSQRQAARAVIGLIEQPDKAWTLDELADLAGASRATLVRLFQKTAGMAPLEFLTDLRLNLARNRLVAGQETMVEIAIAVGYQSESAFSRAFSRHFGVAPSSLRPA
ncbi:MAG TPA: AraC family transcriptional regulator [Terriglobales bacterium]|nr:AraC family transcriptional regulator [Terriglobales bacterium]